MVIIVVIAPTMRGKKNGCIGKRMEEKNGRRKDEIKDNAFEVLFKKNTCSSWSMFN